MQKTENFEIFLISTLFVHGHFFLFQKRETGEIKPPPHLSLEDANVFGISYSFTRGIINSG